MGKIKFLYNKEINRIKWDDCIQNSVNSKIYAFSWYLDIVSDDWNCVMYGDYDLVFPIVMKKIFFLKKIIHPLFCQQLGPFSSSLFLLNNPDISCQILSFLDKNYTNFEFSINHDASQIFKNVILTKYPHISSIDRINLELDLSQDYETIFHNYKTNTKRNLKKTLDFNFSIRLIKDVNNFMTMFKKHVGYKANLKSYHYSIISDLILTCLNKHMGYLYGLYNQKKELLAMSFFINYLNRDVLLFNVSSKLIEANAMTVLIDDYIQKECSKNKVLDFEGSNIKGVKRFYKGFGASERNYIYIQK